MGYPNTLSSLIPYSRKDLAPPMKFSCQKYRTRIYPSLGPNHQFTGNEGMEEVIQ